MAIATNNEVRLNDCKDLLQAIVIQTVRNTAANFNGSASGGWAQEVNAAFRPGGSVTRDVTQPGARFRRSVRLTRTYTVASPVINPVSEATILTQYVNYINQCLNTYPINVGSLDSVEILVKSMLWLVNCAYTFLSTKLIGLTSSLVDNQTVIVYDINATVPVIPITNTKYISNDLYDASSEDSLINCLNDSLVDKLKDATVHNYSSKDNITELLNAFLSNLQSTIHTSVMRYNTSFASCSCCSSSCCSSSWFLAYISV